MCIRDRYASAQRGHQRYNVHESKSLWQNLPFHSISLHREHRLHRRPQSLSTENRAMSNRAMSNLTSQGYSMCPRIEVYRKPKSIRIPSSNPDCLSMMDFHFGSTRTWNLCQMSSLGPRISRKMSGTGTYYAEVIVLLCEGYGTGSGVVNLKSVCLEDVGTFFEQTNSCGKRRRPDRRCR